ncbi:MAG: hypothetical protein HC815_41295 [Richelia sp. RM1_1_1]|nr:hypothetical protein [Richelia sp. RM1_1_1]
MYCMKLFIPPALIATFVCSLFGSSTNIANAKPFVEKIQTQARNTEISGNIVKGDANVGNISCSKITVVLKEFIPQKPQSSQFGEFSIPKEKLLGNSASITGNNLNEGCRYTLRFNYLPVKRAYGASTFKISADSAGIAGNQFVSYPFPNNLDIQVFTPPAPPR